MQIVSTFVSNLHIFKHIKRTFVSILLHLFYFFGFNLDPHISHFCANFTTFHIYTHHVMFVLKDINAE